MNLLKPIISELHDLLIESNLNETVDLRITNLENYDYQINNFVKYQNHPDIKTIKEKVSKVLNSSELVKEFQFEKNLFINLKIKRSCDSNRLEKPTICPLLKHKRNTSLNPF